MIRLAISVEGATEREFVKNIISPHLLTFGLDATPIDIGGNVGIDKVVAEVKRLLPNFDFVTTLYDFYGFKNPKNLPAQELCNELIAKITEKQRFLPYIQQYEFEALLFSHPQILAEELGIAEREKDILDITKVKKPEEINDGFDTCPSRRLKEFFPAFDKVLHGSMVCKQIGLQTIRSECLGFSQWLDRLEKIANKSL